ncbi:MAG: PilZ domain-containing protein [Pseudomonadota bacterium]
MSKENNRKSFRMVLSVEVELILSEHQVIQAKVKDMSDGGIFLTIDDDSALPPTGTEVKLCLKDKVGNEEQPPIIRAIIVRRNTMGVGLKFID